jgi:hypothetical protein
MDYLRTYMNYRVLIIVLISLLLMSCKRNTCKEKFETDSAHIRQIQKLIYADYDTIFARNKVLEYIANVFFDDENLRIYSSINFFRDAGETKSNIEMHKCMLTKRREMFIECHIDDGLFVSEVYSYAYLPNDSLSAATRNIWDIKHLLKLPSEHWYLVSWISGID